MKIDAMKWIFRVILCAAVVLLPVDPAAAEESAQELTKRGDLAYRRGDIVNAMHWYREAAAAGYAPAEAKIGFVLDKAEENEEALQWYRKAAEHGSAEGQHGLAQMYASGEGTAPDLVLAVQWMARAAAQNHLPSVVALARTLESGGPGVPADPAQALQYWQQAAQLNDQGAMLRLARAYRGGEFGLNADADRARQWQQKFDAATSGAGAKP